MRVKIKPPKKIPRASNTPPKKALDQKLTLKKSHAEFPIRKNFQKGLNDISTTKGNFGDNKASHKTRWVRNQLNEALVDTPPGHLADYCVNGFMKQMHKTMAKQA